MKFWVSLWNRPIGLFAKNVIWLVAIVNVFPFVVVVALNRSGESYYYLTKMIIDTFVEDKFAGELEGRPMVGTSSFQELNTVDELWTVCPWTLMLYIQTWLSFGCIITSLFPCFPSSRFKWLEAKFVEEFIYRDGLMYVSMENKLLGPPRISQARIRNDSCILYQHVKRHFNECFAYFSDEFEERASFGALQNLSAFRVDDDDGKSFKVTGEVGSYPCGRYSHVMTMDRAETNVALLHELHTGNWIDRATRAVIIEFSIYNANLDMLCFIQ